MSRRGEKSPAEMAGFALALVALLFGVVAAITGGIVLPLWLVGVVG